MNPDALAWAEDVKTGDSALKSLLMQLGLSYDEQGKSQLDRERLAARCEMSTSDADTALAQLEANGLIPRTQADGREVFVVCYPGTETD